MKTITIDDNSSILDLMRFFMNNIDPNGTHYFVDSVHKALDIIEDEGVRIVFLDFEMPGISGDDAAHFLNEKYKKIDIIFITGYTEYALEAHRVHCSAFVTKPFDEHDIREALQYLRVPVNLDKTLQVRCDKSFSVFANGKPVQFVRKLTMELFAYLIYKEGAIATNGELISVLWDGNIDKQDLLRKHIKDMRDCFGEIGAEDVLIKKRGSIGVDMLKINVEGDTSKIVQEFGWHL
ncbi:MAG: response regulator [Acutalibacteraceae bacterium]|nr:response regulator [Clostridia bacterium]MEE3450904.1 response regulator [Acutalibacteraceae bacterium]